jgi:D-alanine-D-alanine ligase
MRVILIAGGWSSEREVSLSGARCIGSSLERLGHDVVFHDLTGELDAFQRAAHGCDFALINLHGAPGEDGLVQALLDAAGIPYQGSGPAGSFLALHKAASKLVYRAGGLPTPDWEYLPVRPPKGWRTSLEFPIFVKPDCGGSSLGAGLVRDQAALGTIVDAIFGMGEQPLLERAVEGSEITCAVLGEETLPPILIRPGAGATFFDYGSKYNPGGAVEICPAPIPEAVGRVVRDAALAAHRLLGLRGYSRTDFILAGETPFVLETNTIPGMTPTSLLPLAAATAGLDFEALLERLISLGLRDSGVTGR